LAAAFQIYAIKMDVRQKIHGLPEWVSYNFSLDFAWECSQLHFEFSPFLTHLQVLPADPILQQMMAHTGQMWFAVQASGIRFYILTFKVAAI